TSVAAIAGSATIIHPRGGTIVLKEKMVTRVTDNGLLPPRLLPGNPEPIFPDDGATYGFARRAPSVELKWRAAERAGSYRVMVAADRSFRSIFADERVDGTAFPGPLQPPGTYYWRVRGQGG